MGRAECIRKLLEAFGETPARQAPLTLQLCFSFLAMFFIFVYECRSDITSLFPVNQRGVRSTDEPRLLCYVYHLQSGARL